VLERCFLLQPGWHAFAAQCGQLSLLPTPVDGKRQQRSFQKNIGQDGSPPARSRLVLTVALVISLQKSLARCGSSHTAEQ
jgi:hypothetical protein